MVNDIDIITNKLTLKFSEDFDIPSRLKKENKKVDKKNNLNTFVEKRFQEKNKYWKLTIKNMLNKIESKQAWRFLNLMPDVGNNVLNVAYSKDFLDFTDYLILRRDKENCDDKELGNLAMLHTEFQREIERQINIKTPPLAGV